MYFSAALAGRRPLVSVVLGVGHDTDNEERLPVRRPSDDKSVDIAADVEDQATLEVTGLGVGCLDVCPVLPLCFRDNLEPRGELIPCFGILFPEKSKFLLG